MSEEKVKYTGRISEDELKKLEAEHKSVSVLEVPVTDDWSEIAVCYLKPVDRSLMSAVLATTDKVHQKEMLLESLWLAGDERIRKDDELFFSAMPALDGLLMFRMATLKKN